jgi:glycosyltransferase involved in cell wall biosynthesis
MIFNGRFLGTRVTGVQRFGREIMQAGASAGLWGESRILAPVKIAAEQQTFVGQKVEGVGRFSGVPWEQLELPLIARGDFLVNLCFSAPVAYANQLLVMHDIIFARYPNNYTLAFRSWYHVMTRLALRHSRRIATVSKASAQDIASYFDYPLRKIEVIPESGEHILRAEPDDSLHRRFGLERDGYILAVSSLAPNKNFEGVIKALQSMPVVPMPFVVVGARDARVFGGNGQALSGAIEAGYVTDGQLRALYEGAACFVYPSFYEGFGLPPLEAMSCGCPVLVSRSSSLPEVCGNAALYCDPSSPVDIADKLSQLLGDPERRAAMRLEGLAHAATFTWRRGAQALGQILAEESR